LLSAPAASDLQINLKWTQPTGTVAATSYTIERCVGSTPCTFTFLNASKAPSYIDTTVSPLTTYSYQVKAQSSGGGFSGYSNSTSATTAAPTTYDCAVSGPAICYFYDEAGRLKAAKNVSGAKQVYALDPAGNRLVTSSVPTVPMTKPVLTLTPISSTAVNVIWAPATGGSGTYTYVLTRNGVRSRCAR
jgi:hypothetical protein